MSEFSDNQGEVEAAPSSILAGFRAQREAIKARILDMPVPGYDGLYVAYRPVTQALLQRGTDRLKAGEKRPEIGWEANAFVLANSVAEIYVVDADGVRKHVADSFTEEVAAALGEAARRAVDVVRVVYVDDLAMGETTGKLTEWSSSVVSDAEDEYAGN